jgi:hypothetical protein
MTLSASRIDYGSLSRATLARGPDGRLELPGRSVRLHLRCVDPTDMTVYFRGVAADVGSFRLSDNGRFALRLRDGLLDGVRVDLMRRGGTGGETGQMAASLPWLPAEGIAPVMNGQPATGREFSAQIDIDTRVDERALGVRDTERWAARGSVEAPAAGALAELTLEADVQAGRCRADVLRHLSFGHVRSTDLDRNGASTRVASTQNGQVRVVCDAAMPFAFRVMRDERAGTAVTPVGLGIHPSDGELFGLGKTRNGENIGAYTLLWAVDAASDAGELGATRSRDGGRTWAFAGGDVPANHASAERLGFAPRGDSSAGPHPLKALDVGLKATVFIAPRDRLVVDDEIRADGLVTFEIIY